MTRNVDHQCKKYSFDHDDNDIYVDENYPPFLDTLNFRFEKVMTSGDTNQNVWFTNKVIE